ncbi:ATP-binding response regulator [Herbaspirillum seropedicae]|uniref:ATP-binding response regulator n=1 Tax=Herbaspirillum seropedicae TaxID=964 RepID=UPI0028557BD0|nr:hybrid sensor histidine kinase/response regulator [Herbaspirillum seropedicae]MDR6396542.1 signal transduction histidine kinase/ActR/RegA family two-component response regulator [Herbaspirillum seropedicae]
MDASSPPRPGTLAPDAVAHQIQVEQIRLLCGNLGSSVVPGILVALLIVYALGERAGLWPLLAWAGGVIVSKLIDFADARRILAMSITPQQIGAVRRRLMLLHGLDGAAWGALAAVALDTGSPGGSILAIGVLAGVAGNSMSILSPVLPVFISFCIVELGMLAGWVWIMHDPSLQVLSAAALLYVASLLVQARNSARAAQAAITLRYENTELIRRLQHESERTQQALAQAEQANAAKSKFLAAASHDLRQPIHAQGLFLEVLNTTPLDPMQRDVVAKLRRAADNCADMLHTLLDYSRIEAGVVEPQVTRFRVQALVGRISQEMAAQAEAKGLVFRCRESRAVVSADASLTELILRNLVSNAIRYTDRGGILVACRQRGRQAWLEVWDTGAGISAAQQQEIFEEFRQLGNPERDHRKGLGLGLAIAQGLARLQGLTLSVQSVPGRGSVFRLTLPLARQDDSSPAAALRPLPPPVRHDLHGLRVLLIDDDQRVRESMAQLLEHWGCRCHCAESLEQAEALAQQHLPELVISDYRLRQHSNGTDAIAAVRRVLGKPVSALLITGDTAPARLREAAESGIPMLHKPVAPAQLWEQLQRLSGQARQAHPR